MGISTLHGQLGLLQEAIKQERLVLSGLRIAELGNQRVREDILGRGHEIPAKVLYELFGAHHVSFDRNGKDGALPVDLSQPIPEEHRGEFDLLINFGTSEHVVAGAVNVSPRYDPVLAQYWCWWNIDAMCAPGGRMLHQIPEVGAWPRHGQFHYTMPRVMALADACGYDVPIARRYEYQESWGARRLKHTLLLCFRKGAGTFPVHDMFASLMFPEGESWY